MTYSHQSISRFYSRDDFADLCDDNDPCPNYPRRGYGPSDCGCRDCSIHRLMHSPELSLLSSHAHEEKHADDADTDADIYDRALRRVALALNNHWTFEARGEGVAIYQHGRLVKHCETWTQADRWLEDARLTEAMRHYKEGTEP
jgi:hypothetical protein